MSDKKIVVSVTRIAPPTFVFIGKNRIKANECLTIETKPSDKDYKSIVKTLSRLVNSGIIGVCQIGEGLTLDVEPVPLG